MMTISLFSSKRFAFIFALFSLFSSTQIQANATWSLSLDEDNGLPTLIKGGGTALTSDFLFFDKNWGWTNQESNFKSMGPGKYQLSGNNKTLGFTLNANIGKVSNQKMFWDIELNARAAKKDVIGGGVSFKFDREHFSQMLGDPEITADRSGWTWGKGSSRIEMRFNPKPASIFFEKDNKDELRVHFYNGNIPAGKRQYQVTLTLGGEMTVTPTITERFGGDDTSTWIPNMIEWNTSPVNLSFLNAPERPAGKRGFVKTKGEQLIFEDGKIAKFWGTNISAFTIFGTPKENVKSQARRLSELGFNLVRIHHFDSIWVNPNIFGAQSNNSTKIIDENAMDKIDWWIKCLKDEGIYVWLDLHVERHLKSGDGITAFEEIAKNNQDVDLKGYNYVNPSIQQAMRNFNAAYINHVNKYTNVKLVDEPAIAAMLVTNENDVTNHFGNGLLPDKNVPYHSKLYMAAAEKFAKATNLPKDATWRSWEHGPSKLFLNDLEHQFNVSMIKHLRGLGVKVPIVTTSTWGGNPLSALPALTTGDMVDAHAYQPYGALESNPLYTDNAMDWLSAAQVAGMPMSVTEWNAEPFPLPDRHTLPMHIASRASAQGWDAMMQYAYSQEPLKAPTQWDGRPSNWHAYNDPAMLATMPAAALMFRRGDVDEAKTTYALNLGYGLFNNHISPSNSAFIRTASELGKLTIIMPSIKELPWLQKSSVGVESKVFSDPNKSLIAQNSARVDSDNKELSRNWKKGYSTINTPRTQAAIGWIGGENLALNDVEISTSTRNASIIVQSLDDVPINQSRNILISLAARSIPKSGNELPFLSEPVEGQLRIKANKGLKLIKQGASQQGRVISAPYKDGHYLITLDKTLATYWLVLSE